MKFFSIFLFISIVLFSGCESESKVKGNKIIKTSAPKPPEWILKKPTDSKYVYFTGVSTKTQNLQDARKIAINDAVGRLVEYIGFRATKRSKTVKSSDDMESVAGFQMQLTESIEGKGSANVAVDMQDFYYEQYEDGSYIMYVLIKYPESEVKKERTRLENLVKSQRASARSYLDEANAALNNKDALKALDNSYNALLIAEKAAENDDLYEEAKSIIKSILQSIVLSIEKNPNFAFKEGGSDPIIIKALSSKTSSPFAGLTLKATSSEAEIAAVKGNNTDKNGLIYYESAKILKPNSDKAYIKVFPDLSKFVNLQDLDPDFYDELLKIQKSKTIDLSLKISQRDKVIPSGVFILKEGKTTTFSKEMNDALSLELANNGFQIISLDIPEKVYINNNTESSLRDSIIEYVINKYPDVKRLYFGYHKENLIGKLSSDTFKEFNVDTGDLQIAEATLKLSIVNIETKKVVKGTDIVVRGQGLNADQAITSANKRVIEKIRKDLNSLIAIQ